MRVGLGGIGSPLCIYTQVTIVLQRHHTVTRVEEIEKS